MIAAFAGSFDPITLGHLDLIERASSMYEKVIVLVSFNAAKKEAFSLREKMEWIRRAAAHLCNVQVEACTGTAAETARSLGASVLIRGVRNAADLEYEANMAWMNSRIAPEIETVCLFSRPEYSYVSSSNVRELLRCRIKPAGLVPSVILEDLCRTAWKTEE